MNKRGIVTAGLVMAALSACDGGAGGEGGAYEACKRAVESTLKAPSTADFSGPLHSDITADGDTYKVAGYVDSENSFGASLRSNFTCTVRDTGGDWELVDLDVS
jgi:hypothetical protein